MWKVNYLTEILGECTIPEDVRAGLVALDNEAYEQAWNRFYHAYESKKLSGEAKGQICYFLYCVMEKIPSNHPFIETLMKADTYLSRNVREKNISLEYGRKYLARKYLEKSAQLNYDLGLIDYSLICVGYGKFPYENDIDNVMAGMDWAKVMKEHKDREVRAVAHIIFAKYYYHKRLDEYIEDVKKAKDERKTVDPSRNSMIVKEFAANVKKANAEHTDNDYVNFYLANLYGNILFSGYENRTYYDPKKGYELACKVIENSYDTKLVEEATDLKETILKHYPKFGR